MLTSTMDDLFKYLIFKQNVMNRHRFPSLRALTNNRHFHDQFSFLKCLQLLINYSPTAVSEQEMTLEERKACNFSIQLSFERQYQHMLLEILCPILAEPNDKFEKAAKEGQTVYETSMGEQMNKRYSSFINYV